MKYMGSKNKLSKELAPIINKLIKENNIDTYIEPFVGGANMIDKIQCTSKIGCDIHKQLIELLKYVQINSDELPYDISENVYKEVKNNKEIYEDWYLGLVGFCASFSAIYFDTYARSFKADKVTPRNMSNEAIRNLKKQAPSLKDIKFKCCSFLDLPKDKIQGCVIYCDPPYRKTSKYKTEEFPYEEFYQWCRDMSIHNTVLISEYNMPDDFECIWQKETKVLIASNKKHNDINNKRIEKLFTYNQNNNLLK